MSGTVVSGRIGQSRSDGVDILRFVAMTLVVAQHCDLAPFGWVGVWLFYVISGFVVTKSLGADDGSGLLATLGAFYRRRILRIVPSYLLFVLVALGALYVLGDFPPSQEILSLLVFNTNAYAAKFDMWRPQFPISHLWTLSVEMKFYISAGLLLILLKGRALALTLIGIIIASTLGRLTFDAAYNGPAVASYLHLWAIFHGDAFAAGCLVAVLRDRISVRSMTALTILGGVLMVLYAVAYAWANIAFGGAVGLDIIRDIVSGNVEGQFREAVIYTPLVVLFSGVVALAYLKPLPDAGWVRALSRWGRASYSGYLWHFAVITLVQAILVMCGVALGGRWAAMPGKALLFILSMALLVPVSLAFYRWVEKPAARAGGVLFDGVERMIKRRRQLEA